MQHEAALGFDRTAAHDLDHAGARRQLDHVGGRDHVELHQQIGRLMFGAWWLTTIPSRAFGGSVAQE